MNDFDKMSAIAKANGRIWSANLASNFIRANRHSKGWDITIGVGHDAGDLFSAGHIVGALYMVHVDEWKVNRADLVAEKDARISDLEKSLKRLLIHAERMLPLDLVEYGRIDWMAVAINEAKALLGGEHA